MAAWRSLTDDDFEARNDRLEARAHIDFDGCTDYDWDGTLTEGESGCPSTDTDGGRNPGVAKPSLALPSVSAASVLLRGVERVITNLEDGMSDVDRDDWPTHQPGPAYEAPIPGVHWYGGCEPGYPKVNPATGICEGCGERACRECGREACPDHLEVAA